MPDSTPIDVRLRTIRWECDGVLRLTLEPLVGVLPAPEPGAHIDLHLPGGFVRQYSLTIGSSERRYVIGVLREPHGRGGSIALHDGLRAGDRLRISAPRNAFALDGGEAPVWLLGGGIGITPLLAMAEHLSGTRRSWSLTACVRSRERLAFADEIARLGGRVHVDDEAGLPDLHTLVAAAPANARLYCCGPGPMLDAFIAATVGREPDLVHLERFTPAAPELGSGELRVELARSARTVIVAGNQSILDAILAAGVDVPNSCRVGVCGTCETRVLRGEPEHHDLVLTDEERAQGRMMLCCSRALGDTLVLDL
ncbi:MAG: PDR/VanB family oxidoreductase [Burkholderiaceae bacterium]